MKVTSISKIQIQDKQKELLGTSFIEQINAAAIGHTAKEYIFPTDKFIILKNKYGLKEEDQTAYPSSGPIVQTKKVLTKSKAQKRKCLSCFRKKK